MSIVFIDVNGTALRTEMQGKYYRAVLSEFFAMGGGRDDKEALAKVTEKLPEGNAGEIWYREHLKGFNLAEQQEIISHEFAPISIQQMKIIDAKVSQKIIEDTTEKSAFPKIRELIIDLHSEGNEVYLLSNATKREATILAYRADILKGVTEVLTTETDSKEVILTKMSDRGAIYIGDSVSDLKAARAAGVTPIITLGDFPEDRKKFEDLQAPHIVTADNLYGKVMQMIHPENSAVLNKLINHRLER